MSNNGTIQTSGVFDNPVEVTRNTTKHEVNILYPGDRVAKVTVRVGRDGSVSQSEAEAQERQRLLSMDTVNFTANLEKDLASALKQYEEIAGYDQKTGAPLLRVTGKARENLEMRIQNLKRGLHIANHERSNAIRVQAEEAKVRAAHKARIEAAAKVRAQELLEQEEVEKLARLEVARKKAASAPKGETGA